MVLMQFTCCCTCHAASCTVPGTERTAEVFIAPTIKLYLRTVTPCILGKNLRRFGENVYLYFEDIRVMIQVRSL